MNLAEQSKLTQQKLKDCPPLKHDVVLQELYKQAYSGPHGKYPDNETLLIRIAQHIVKGYYPQYRPKSLEFTLLAASKEKYASVVSDPSSKTASPITIVSDTFDSPALLVSTLGHEIIHQFQMQRNYSSVYLLGLNDIIRNLWELEAHTWELEPKSFNWAIGDKQPQILSCFTQKETEEAKSNLDFYKTQVRKSIGDLVGGLRGSTYSPALEKWLNLDDWTRKVWISDVKNKDWKNWK